MDTVFEINGAFSNPSVLCAPDLAEGFIRSPGNHRGRKSVSVPARRQGACDLAATEVRVAAEQSADARSRRIEARLEAVGFSLALLFVAGLVALGVWATVRWADSIRQAQALMQPSAYAEPQSFMVQNVSPFQR